jgi:hypothetical protein
MGQKNIVLRLLTVNKRGDGASTKLLYNYISESALDKVCILLEGEYCRSYMQIPLISLGTFHISGNTSDCLGERLPTA